jgi:hypothetical protein
VLTKFWKVLHRRRNVTQVAFFGLHLFFGLSWSIGCRPRRPGTDVMSFEIFSQKKMAETLAFFWSKRSWIMQKYDRNIGFWEKCQFSPKILLITSTPANKIVAAKSTQGMWIRRISTHRLQNLPTVRLTEMWACRVPCTSLKEITPGVNVRITLFCDFRRKNWCFSQEPMLLSNFCKKLALVLALKMPIFSSSIYAKIFKNRNIGVRICTT